MANAQGTGGVSGNSNSAAGMTPKPSVKFSGTLEQFAINADGQALLYPGKELSTNDSVSGDGYLHHLTKFNRFDLPEGFLWGGGHRGYIFMTRPDLNLFDEQNLTQLNMNNQTASRLAFREIARNGTTVDKENLAMLQQNTGFANAYMPIFTNLSKGYSPEDQVLDTLEKGETHHGMKIKYGKHAGHSRSAGTFTLTLTDTKFYPVYKTLAIWTDYIEMVFLGDMKPKDYYIKYGILDYAVSLYYLVTRSDGAEIVYWEKLQGVFPKNRPDSAFATNKGEFTYPEYNVQFEYAMKSKSGILDPVVLSELNGISGFAKKARSDEVMKLLDDTGSYYSTYNREDDTHGVPLVNAPKVEMSKGKFYLRWI